MTDKIILKKVIEKALKNKMPPRIIDKGTFYQMYFTMKGKTGKKLIEPKFIISGCYGLIFNHEFAKAFWGETTQWTHLADGEPIETVNFIPDEVERWGEYEARNGWQYHLQIIVLEPDPIKYLKRFI